MTRRSLLLLLLIGILMASCAPSAAGQATPDINGTIDASAKTMVAAIGFTQTALAPPATNTALPTATALPTSTALAVATQTVAYVPQPVLAAATATPTGPTPTPLASSLGVGCLNLYLIRSYTVPDSPLNPGQDFMQYWQVENNGTCDWMYVFQIVFVSGDKLGETTSIRFSNRKGPNETTTFSVNLHAPTKAGTYKSAWRFSDGGGTTFGSVLPVNITVGGPTKTPKSDTSGTAVAQTVAAGAQQTSAAAAQQTAVQGAIGTAVAQTQAANATATCAAFLEKNPPPCPP